MQIYFGKSSLQINTYVNNYLSNPQELEQWCRTFSSAVDIINAFKNKLIYADLTILLGGSYYLVIGKSYIAGDGDNTSNLIQYFPDYSTTEDLDQKYGLYFFRRPIGLLTLVPVSITKKLQDNISTNNKKNFETSYYKTTNNINYIAELNFSNSTITTEKDKIQTEFHNAMVDNSDYGNTALGKHSFRLGDIVKYYDIDRGCWIIETISKKETHVKQTTTNIGAMATDDFTTIIGTKSKPNLLTYKYVSPNTVTITIDLKTNNEYNDYLTY